MKRYFMKVAWLICAISLLGNVTPAAAQEAAPAKALTPLEQTLLSSERDFIAAAKKVTLHFSSGLCPQISLSSASTGSSTNART